MPNLVNGIGIFIVILKLFANNGPVTNMLFESGLVPDTFSFVDKAWSTRGLIASMNLMWFGNTTILLMAGIMGIDQTVIESAQVDGGI